MKELMVFIVVCVGVFAIFIAPGQRSEHHTAQHADILTAIQECAQ